MSKIPITGFSVNRPWPWAMVHATSGRAPLRLIYSAWSLPTERVDTYVALHANMNWDATSAAYLREELNVTVPDATAPEQPFNVIFAVAQWAACVTECAELPLRQRPWFCASYLWVLARFTLIEPVPCPPGANFFTLTTEVLQAVRVRYRKALQP